MAITTYKRDNQLVFRMIFTMFLLATLFIGFLSFLFAMGFSPILILAIAIFMAGFQYFYSDKMVLKTTGAKIVTPDQEPKLHKLIDELCNTSDLPKPKHIAIMDTSVPNAFATGRNPKNAVIAVTKGLLNRLNQKELEAVLAHELSHVKNRDIMVLTWASIIVIMAGYLMQMLFWMSLFGGFGGGSRDRNSGGQAMIIMMAIWIGTIIVYFIAQMLIMTLSRYRELAADRGAAMITGNPMDLASALKKIEQEVSNTPEKQVRNVEHASAFFIIPAIKSNFVASLMSSHPSTEKRIQKLKDMKKMYTASKQEYTKFNIDISKK
ncbi:MAG: zinc metalloprotease HtpX [Dehalococcoidia bacterium]